MYSNLSRYTSVEERDRFSLGFIQEKKRRERCRYGAAAERLGRGEGTKEGNRRQEVSPSFLAGPIS